MAKKNSNKKLYIISAVIIVLVLVIGVVGKQMGWIGGTNAKEVELGKVAFVSIVEKVNASGKIQPVEEVKLSPLVSGEIMDIFVKEGDSVVAGQLLLRIRPENLESVLERTIATLNTQKANVAQAKARLAQSKAQHIRSEQIYNRNKKLFEEKAISEQEFEASEAEFSVAKADLSAAEEGVEAAKFTVLSAEASVREARENLSFTSIYSPMKGVVTNLAVEKGERVVGTSQMAGTELMRIANLTNMEVRVNVNENDIIRISRGDTVIIDVDAYSYLNVEFAGVVSSIANSAKTAATATTTDAVTEFEVKIRILNESYEVLNQVDRGESLLQANQTPFRPGMTASVEIITDKRENVLGVPLNAVTTRNQREIAGQMRFGPKAGGDGAAAERESAGRNRASDELKEVVFVTRGDTLDIVEVKTGISDFDNIQILSGLELDETIVVGPYLQVSKLLKRGDVYKQKDSGGFNRPEQVASSN